MFWFIDAFKNYANFKGRSHRTAFWMFALFNLIILIVVLIVGAFHPEIGTILYVICSLAVFVPSLSLGARRLHDTNRSGWWQLLYLTSIGSIVLIVFWCMDSDESDNRYGPNPKAAGRQVGRRRAAPAPAPAPTPASPPTPFDCILTGRDGDGAVVVLDLRRDALGTPGGAVIGRDPMASSHVVVGESVSRSHARVFARDGVLYVEDLDSTNGTYLNGYRLIEKQRERVYDGDELVLGAMALRVELRT